MSDASGALNQIRRVNHAAAKNIVDALGGVQGIVSVIDAILGANQAANAQLSAIQDELKQSTDSASSERGRSWRGALESVA